MTSMQPIFPWRGYVNQLTYGADLRTPVPDEVVERITHELIRQWFFTHAVENYYDAAVAGLNSGKRLAFTDDQDEEATRDLLIRVVARLDERRPWPEHPFYQGERSEWAALRDAPVAAVVPQSEREVRRRLNRGFAAVDTEAGRVKVLILRLRTGQTVVLRSGPAGCDLLTGDDPAPTIAAFRELTGLDAEPVPSPGTARPT